MNCMITTPAQPANSFRIKLELTSRNRIDAILLDQLRNQTQNLELSKISRAALKKLFKEKRIQIKGQNAVPSSMLAVGTTFVDILGFTDTSAS